MGAVKPLVTVRAALWSQGNNTAEILIPPRNTLEHRAQLPKEVLFLTLILTLTHTQYSAAVCRCQWSTFLLSIQFKGISLSSLVVVCFCLLSSCASLSVYGSIAHPSHQGPATLSPSHQTSTLTQDTSHHTHTHSVSHTHT